jgi:hypothetical protein
VLRQPIMGLFAVAALCGCTSDLAQREAAAAAMQFVQATPVQACQLLAPDTLEELSDDAGTSCAVAMAQLNLPRRGAIQTVEVAGESAQVKLEDQVIFLARFPEGWRVTAAGCRRTDADPSNSYDCEVES